MSSLGDRVAACSAVVLVLSGCVEIDPSYGESYTTGDPTSAGPGTTGPGTAGTDDTDDTESSGASACDCGPWELCEAGACTTPARILFINLEGATTVFGVADASMDSHNLYPELAGTWAGYSADPAQRQALLDAIAAQWAPFDVLVTDQRPEASAAPYLMAIVTADPPPAGFEGVAWIAFPDCGDLIARDVTFVFDAPGDGFTTQQHANSTSGAIARTFGLQLTSSPDDITGFGGQFVDACIARSENPPCDAHDPSVCGGDASQQNSFRVLEALLGLRG
ncbi:MAG: hypothetical protein KDK70_02375 [Myxococcales bacterium]|nr:hypothetical protein [Myxococcales bacterium]